MSLGKGSSAGTNTVVQQSQPPQQFLQAYQQLMNRANATASQPLQGYGGAMVAGFNPEQQASFANTNQAAGAAQPFINSAANQTALGAQGVFPQVQKFSGQNVNQYYSPYQNDVINSTMANIDRSNQIQQNQLLGSAIGSGNAFGGDRAGVAAAELARTQGLARGQTLSGLENQGYSQALGELNNQQQLQLQGLSADKQRQLQGAGQMAGLGSLAQQTGLAGASAQMQVGGQQQQLQQELLNIPYEQYLQKQSYPFQTTGFLAPMVENLGAGAGGTSSTTGPSPSTLSQLGGLGMSGLGLVGATGGFGAGGWLTSLLGGGAGAAGLAGALGAGAGVTAGGGIADLLGSGMGLGLALEKGGRVGYDEGGAIPTASGSGTSDNFASLDPAALQHLAMIYPAATPEGAAIRKAMMAKSSSPMSSAPLAPSAPPTPSFAGIGAQPAQPMAGGGIAGITSLDPIDPKVSEGGVDAGPYAILGDNYSNDAYQSGTDNGAYAPPGHAQHPFSHRLPTVAKISSPVPQSAALGADHSVTPHGGLGIPQPPPQMDGASSSPDGAQGADAALTTGEQIGHTVDPGAGGGGGGFSGPTDPNDKMGGMLDSPWLGVLEGGLATMGGTSPFAAVNIGRGALTGVQGAITQQQQKAEIGLKRAEAEKSQADADMQRMLVKAQGIAMEGMGSAISGAGGGGSGSGATNVSASSGGGDGYDFGGIASYAPRAAALMQQATYMARFPQFKGMADGLFKQAESDPAYIRGQEFVKKGLLPDGNGGWRMPADTRENQQRLSLLGQHDASKPTIMYGPDNKPQYISYSEQTADGKTIMHQFPYSPQTAADMGIGEGGGGGGGNFKPQTQPWADASARVPAEVLGKKYAPVFGATEQKYGLHDGLLPAMAWTESHFDPNAISPKNAEGILQFMPQTAKDYNVNTRDPTSSINGAGHMMSDLMAKYKGNEMYALAGYNWGAGNVDKWIKKTGGDTSKLPTETQHYILAVDAAMQPGAEPPGIAGDAGDAGGTTSATVNGRPVSTAPTTGGVVTADPAAVAGATTRATTYAKYPDQFASESQAAGVGNARLDQMLNESHTWDPGKPADFWGNFKTWMAPILPNSQWLQQSVADQAQFNKNVGGLQRDVMNTLGTGLAASEYEAVGKSLINQGMTRRTVVGMAMQMKGLNDYARARNDAYVDKDTIMPGVDDQHFIPAFQKAAGPAAFVMLEAYHNAQLGDADGQATWDSMTKNLNSTAAGRKTLASLQQQMKFIEDNNLFQTPGPQ